MSKKLFNILDAKKNKLYTFELPIVLIKLICEFVYKDDLCFNYIIFNKLIENIKYFDFICKSYDINRYIYEKQNKLTRDRLFNLKNNEFFNELLPVFNFLVSNKKWFKKNMGEICFNNFKFTYYENFIDIFIHEYYNRVRLGCGVYNDSLIKELTLTKLYMYSCILLLKAYFPLKVYYGVNKKTRRINFKQIYNIINQNSIEKSNDKRLNTKFAKFIYFFDIFYTNK